MNTPNLFDPLGGAFLNNHRDPEDPRERRESTVRGKPTGVAIAAMTLGLLLVGFFAATGNNETETARSIAVARVAP
jgi:hypothetical protein